ncbi:MAG: type II secretion system protein [Athalassotoga sp.]|uniref:type II secretion system protein n=1 Tax=Athalassotoga sp. TaxID=2022597 RepID=UPI003D04BDB0
MRKKREGFTLIELLIVMAVIAALMGALIPVALSAINHANATRIAENLQSLVTQVQQYAYSNHTLPTISDLSTSVSGGNINDYVIGTYSGGNLRLLIKH